MTSTHPAFHFALGMAVGTVVALPGLLSGWRQHLPLARAFVRWFLLSYGLGVYATGPSILHWLGAPAAFCHSGAMNVFLFHSLVHRLHPGGLLIGELTIVLLVAAQYSLVLLAIWRLRRPLRRVE